jgi:hypothetical protein
MSTVVVLGVLWALAAVPLIVRSLNERRELPMEEFQRAMGALQGPGVPTDGLGPRTAGRRRLVSVLTYTPGVALLGFGVPTQDATVLAVGLALVNLGTAHRLAALVVDSTHPRPLSPSVSAIPFAFEPIVDEGPGDAHAGGDGWQIIWTEPRRVDDLVLVDANVS